MRPWWTLKRDASMWKAIHQPRLRGQLRLTLESERKCHCKCSRRRGGGLTNLFVNERPVGWHNHRNYVNLWCWQYRAGRQRDHVEFNMQPVDSLLSHYPASIPNPGINLFLPSWRINIADYEFHGHCAIGIQSRPTKRHIKDISGARRAAKVDTRRSV